MLKRCFLCLVLVAPALGGSPEAGNPASAGIGSTGPQRIADVPEDGRPPDYFPLTSPKRREYDIEYKGLIFRGRGKMVTTVRTQVVDGKEYAAHTTSLTGTPWDRTFTSLYRVSPQGIMIRGAEGDKEQLFLPQPLRPDLEWTTKLDDVPAAHKVTGREDVICGGTTYRGCMKVVSSHGSGSTTFRWFAPGFGVVKHEARSSILSSTTTLTGGQ